jgi:hypothetical protein
VYQHLEHNIRVHDLINMADIPAENNPVNRRDDAMLLPVARVAKAHKILYSLTAKNGWIFLVMNLAR